MSYQNPIIPGFYPDPSCIRVDDTFYLINSSFQFFPGLPIHRSKDLVNWELIGHAINRPDQIDLSFATTKVNNAARGEIFTAGLYAPTIRYHDGVFYIVATNLTGRHDMPTTEDFAPSNFIIKATDLADPKSFSDCIYFDFHGIDPSLLFDDDGRVYMQGSFIIGYKFKPATTIKQAEIDLDTGELKSELKEIWAGSGGKVPEGPHMYKKDGIYWLMLAEGGTHRGHCITMGKSNSPWGPFESCSENPLLTTEGPQSELQCIGHGELFDDTNGNWWCTMLARRELGGHFPLGRETCLTPASWPAGEFPKIESLRLNQKVDGRRVVAKALRSHLQKVTLNSPDAVFLRGFNPEFYREEGDKLILTGAGTDIGAPEDMVTFLGQRQTSLRSEARVQLKIDDESSSMGSCGLAIYQDTFRYISLEVNSDNRLSLVELEAGKEPSVQQAPILSECSDLALIISSTLQEYSFSYSACIRGKWGDELLLGTHSTKAFSTDDFTGPAYAIYTSGTRSAKFQDFQTRVLS